MADSGVHPNGSVTFTSTSRMLALQTRVLHKMFGIDCGSWYIENHGGFGTNPIWRLSPRRTQSQRIDGKQSKLLRVKAIERNVASAPCYDISTDDHYVYLPEHDVTVSNCDCISILLASMLQSVGYPVKLHVMQTKGADSWSHILIKVGLPPQGPTAWLPLDGSVNEAAGWYPPKDIVVKTKDYLLGGDAG
jgi:hypothetical protein